MYWRGVYESSGSEEDDIRCKYSNIASGIWLGLLFLYGECAVSYIFQYTYGICLSGRLLSYCQRIATYLCMDGIYLDHFVYEYSDSLSWLHIWIPSILFLNDSSNVCNRIYGL